MRNAFADELAKLAKEDERVVLLSGDIGNKLFDSFKKNAPTRFYNCGVAEANMTGVAAGLAMLGYRPFIYSITPFVTVRCLEQIRIDICYHDLPVTIVGTGAGLSYAELGPTHHSCDDIGLLRILPNMSVVCPCDSMEVVGALRATLKQNKPMYIRLGKKGEAKIHSDVPPFEIGKSITIKQGYDICLLSTGNMISTALEIAGKLEKENKTVRVESFHTVKPLDNKLLHELFKQYAFIATIEEHSLIGGLGSSIVEWASDHGYSQTKVIRFGTTDEFLPHIGSQTYARKYLGLCPEKMTNRLLGAIN